MGLFARLRFRAAFWGRALLLLPATLLHELSHLIVAILTGSRVHGLSLWPKIEWRDGTPVSLEYGHVRYVPRLAAAHIFVGLSPLLLFPLSAWLLHCAGMYLWPLPVRLDEVAFHHPRDWICATLALYALIGAVPSKPDVANAVKGLVSPSGLLLFAGAVCLAASEAGFCGK